MQRRWLFLLVLLPIFTVWFVCSLARGDIFWPQPKSAASRTGSLKLILWVSRERVIPGDEVEIRFTVKNTRGKVRVVELEDKPVMDILINIRTPDNNSFPTTYWSDGQDITPEMRRLELAPGESRTIEMQWIAVEDSNYQAEIVGVMHGEHRDTRVVVGICEGHCGGGY